MTYAHVAHLSVAIVDIFHAFQLLWNMIMTSLTKHQVFYILQSIEMLESVARADKKGGKQLMSLMQYTKVLK